jgi:hypothetical protein
MEPKVALKPGMEYGVDGQLIGMDPAELGPAGLRALGHARMSPLDALRERCIDCCAGSKSEVRKCVAVACASWPFRLGHNPWIERAPLTDEQKAAFKAKMSGGRRENF